MNPVVGLVSGKHHHGELNHGRSFAIGIGLNLAYVSVEAMFGFGMGSLALVSDAGHNLSDVLGLVLAWMGSVLARRRPTPVRTYGMRRASILAAVGNAFLLMIACGAIAWESVQRFIHPAPVEGGIIAGVAAVGVVINGVTAMLFFRGRRSDINIRGAFLHMAADAVVSAGVVAGGLIVAASGWFWIDPLIGLGIVVVIASSTWGLLRDSMSLAIDAFPAGMDPAMVEKLLMGLPGVTAVHDLHVWGMSTTETALTAHLVRPEGQPTGSFYRTASRELHKQFGIEHTTLQVELPEAEVECDQAPNDVV